MCKAAENAATDAAAIDAVPMVTEPEPQSLSAHTGLKPKTVKRESKSGESEGSDASFHSHDSSASNKSGSISSESADDEQPELVIENGQHEAAAEPDVVVEGGQPATHAVHEVVEQLEQAAVVESTLVSHKPCPYLSDFQLQQVEPLGPVVKPEAIEGAADTSDDIEDEVAAGNSEQIPEEAVPQPDAPVVDNAIPQEPVADATDAEDGGDVEPQEPMVDGANAEIAENAEPQEHVSEESSDSVEVPFPQIPQAVVNTQAHENILEQGLHPFNDYAYNCCRASS